MKKKRLLLIIVTSLLILLIPYLAMQYSEDVNWSFFDFLIAGSLLIGTGVLIDLVFSKVKNSSYRVTIILLLLFILFLIWAELAVGIF